MSEQFRTIVEREVVPLMIACKYEYNSHLPAHQQHILVLEKFDIVVCAATKEGAVTKLQRHFAALSGD